MYENHKINKLQKVLYDGGFKVCTTLIKTGIWPLALEACNLIMASMLGNPVKPKFNTYDIRIPCEHPPLCYDFSNVDKFLALPEVVEALNV